MNLLKDNTIFLDYRSTFDSPLREAWLGLVDDVNALAKLESSDRSLGALAGRVIRVEGERTKIPDGVFIDVISDGTLGDLQLPRS